MLPVARIVVASPARTRGAGRSSVMTGRVVGLGILVRFGFQFFKLNIRIRLINWLTKSNFEQIK